MARTILLVALLLAVCQAYFQPTIPGVQYVGAGACIDAKRNDYDTEWVSFDPTQVSAEEGFMACQLVACKVADPPKLLKVVGFSYAPTFSDPTWCPSGRCCALQFEDGTVPPDGKGQMSTSKIGTGPISGAVPATKPGLFCYSLTKPGFQKWEVPHALALHLPAPASFAMFAAGAVTMFTVGGLMLMRRRRVYMGEESSHLTIDVAE